MQSVGAHLVAIAAKKLKSGKVAAIIALDPASPGFSIDDPQNRLDETDAKYVQVMIIYIRKFFNF